MVCPPRDCQDWVGLGTGPLSPDAAGSWAVLPACGAVVVFAGTVRDSSEGRQGVTRLVYEAYDGQAERRMEAICAEARRRWPELGRIALLHRTGPVALAEVSVVVAVSAPHRGEAFEAARWCIDTVKETVPIWKQEAWSGGLDWATGAQDIAQEMPGATTSAGTGPGC